MNMKLLNCKHRRAGRSYTHNLVSNAMLSCTWRETAQFVRQDRCKSHAHHLRPETKQQRRCNIPFYDAKAKFRILSLKLLANLPSHKHNLSKLNESRLQNLNESLNRNILFNTWKNDGKESKNTLGTDLSTSNHFHKA